jgi:hypothetical protein
VKTPADDVVLREQTAVRKVEPDSMCGGREGDEKECMRGLGKICLGFGWTLIFVSPVLFTSNHNAPRVLLVEEKQRERPALARRVAAVDSLVGLHGGATIIPLDCP